MLARVALRAPGGRVGEVDLVGHEKHFNWVLNGVATVARPQDLRAVAAGASPYPGRDPRFALTLFGTGVLSLVERFDIEFTLIFQPNDQIL